MIVTTNQPWNLSQLLIMDPRHDLWALWRSLRILDDSLTCAQVSGSPRCSK